MPKIPNRNDYYFHNGKFVLRNKWTKRFKLGMIIGMFFGGILGSSVTSSHLVDTTMLTVKSTEQKMTEYILDKNKNVDKKEAYTIVSSTMKWANEFEVDPFLVLAVQEVESTFNKYAISSAGALGVMQVIPSWHLDKIKTALKDVGNPELFDIHTNIYLGTWVLKSCLKQFNLTKNSLLCYNGSNAKPNGYDQKVLSSYSNIKKYVKES